MKRITAPMIAGFGSSFLFAFLVYPALFTLRKATRPQADPGRFLGRERKGSVVAVRPDRGSRPTGLARRRGLVRLHEGSFLAPVRSGGRNSANLYTAVVTMPRGVP